MVDNLKFKICLFLSLLLIGLGYILMQPIYEGFDEPQHYSRMREGFASQISPSFYMDQSVIDYSGPIAYSSGHPPFDGGLNYKNFFSRNIFSESYLEKYGHTSSNPGFSPSSIQNPENHQPPLYYLFFSKLASASSFLSLSDQTVFLRFISYFLALLGLYFSFESMQNLSSIIGDKASQFSFKSGFLFYPIIFPMFFFEFSRLGNDALCIFLLGIFFYLFTIWLKEFNSIKISFLIGLILSFGIFTKAFFIPITFIFICFVLYQMGIKKDYSSKVTASKLAMFLPIILITGIWFLSTDFFTSFFNGSWDSSRLNVEVSFADQFRNNFVLSTFIRGLIVPFVTFIWAGSHSLVHMPTLMYLPFFFTTIWIVFHLIKEINANSRLKILLLSFAFLSSIYIGLAWHGVMTLILIGIVDSPGWYFHIFAPWLAPILGISIFSILASPTKTRLFIIFICYAFLFHLSGIWFYLSLYGGCSSKAPDKSFLFPTNYLCFDNLPIIFNNLKVIAHPYLSLICFLFGFSLMIYLISCVITFKKNQI